MCVMVGKETVVHILSLLRMFQTYGIVGPGMCCVCVCATCPMLTLLTLYSNMFYFTE